MVTVLGSGRGPFRLSQAEQWYFLVLGESSRGELRIDNIVAQGDLKCTAGTRYKLDFGALKGGFQFSGQTGRLGQVVSARAVFDAELHKDAVL
jgi:hypothetical protein